MNGFLILLFGDDYIPGRGRIKRREVPSEVTEQACVAAARRVIKLKHILWRNVIARSPLAASLHSVRAGA